jgi:hypothetical protein
MGVVGILDRKVMQLELPLHAAEHAMSGSCRPIQTTWSGLLRQLAASSMAMLATRRPST